MARKSLSSISLIMEIENGVDSKGTTVYKSKSYSNINPSSTTEDILYVSSAIKDILNVTTRNIYVKETSLLTNE